VRIRSTKEGVGETSGQAAGLHFQRVHSAREDPAGKCFFPFAETLRDFTTELRLRDNLDPDVFADALECSGPDGRSTPRLLAIKALSQQGS
jgi:hypothetical protein